MESVPAWFGPVDTAMVRAGEVSGELPSVLELMSADQSRADEIAQKLIGALSYPILVGIAGLAVSVFLSTSTLPQLSSVLVDAGLEPPALTEAVMSTGQGIFRHGWLMALSLVLVLIAAASALRHANRTGRLSEHSGARLVPSVLRRLTLARLAITLSSLVRVGVPFIESLRVARSTLGGVGSSSLRSALRSAEQKAAAGEPLHAALNDGLWFDEEFRRLIQVGETAGELDDVLYQLGSRYEHKSRRAIDRLVSLVEPTAIVLLALLIGTVVLAAVLPVLQLQEIVR